MHAVLIFHFEPRTYFTPSFAAAYILRSTKCCREFLERQKVHITIRAYT